MSYRAIVRFKSNHRITEVQLITNVCIKFLGNLLGLKTTHFNLLSGLKEKVRASPNHHSSSVDHKMSWQSIPYLLRCLSLNQGSVLFVLDPGDGGLQSDRWAGGPEALCCDCEPGTENSHHGVSDLQQTHSELLNKAGRRVHDLP